MATGNGKLTALYVKNAKQGKHFDGNGLYVEVMPSGSRLWRMKYRHANKEKRLAFGAFPEVNIAEARDKAAKARALLRDGIDPSAAKAERTASAKRAAYSVFPLVASSWLAKMKPGWADETHRKAAYVVDTYLSPALRRQSVATLTTKQAADALAGIPPSLAAKARGYLNNIVNHAIHEGLREDGRLLSLRGVLPKAEKGHIPAAVDLADVRKLTKAIEDYPIAVTRAALKVAMLTAQRPGTVARMEWAEVDLDAGEWSIPAAKMKTRHAHIVPLPAQAVEALRGLLIYTDGKRYVFPPLYQQATEHLHRDSLSNALRKMGFQGVHATHGFRGMFRTVARERLNIAADVLEAQLAHAKKDEIQKAYDRTQFLDERKVAMQRWADYLDSLRADTGKVIGFRRKAG
ncbi:integrase [Lysobacter niastensis]|uniref:Integrase n=1 Tax=Lysobacter niastensis TaxID=380629 RepID=A0ABU1WA21_9GAMM|nr:integrase arm-type DNA-binding domain-containing protein [Lysobacter niastensis]MDR7134403.1 integrase [Lysobacter niastensis]